MKELGSLLRRWPLLLVGLALFVFGISLAEGEDKSDARALLLGVASVMIGAGLVVVVNNETTRKDDEESPTGGDPGEGD